MDRHRNQTQLACSCRAGASRWTERASSTFSRLAAVPVLVGTWLLHCQSAGCSSAATSFILAEAAAAHWFMLPHDMSCRYHAAIQTQAFTLHGMDLPRLATVRCCELHSCDLLQHFCELHRVLHFNLHHACTWAFDTGRITPATPSRLYQLSIMVWRGRLASTALQLAAAGLINLLTLALPLLCVNAASCTK